MKFRFGEERKKKITTFSALVPDIVRDLNIKDTFIIENLKLKWPGYVGSILASHSYPERIIKKTVIVNVDHSAFAGELAIHSDEILKKISDDFGDNLIFKIKFEVKKSRWGKRD